MFSGDFRESTEKEVLISNVSGDILESLVRYCYMGIIDVNENNAQLILPQASFMLFPEVVKACSIFLISTINPGNCLSMAKYAKLYSCQALLESAEDHMKEQFENVSVTDQFLKLDQEELEEYLSFDNLNVENEKQVFEAAMKWLNHDLENRSSTREKLILICGYEVRCFDLNTKFWHEFASMLTGRRWSVEVLNESVYAVGLLIHGTTNIVKRWDSKLNRWSKVKGMNNARSEHCTAIVNDKLYAIGGYGKTGNLNSVECYDPITNSWRVCSPLITARLYARAVAVNEEIFVFGGINDNSGTLNCIEKYNPETNTWTTVGQMTCKRHSMGAYLFNKKIYLFGGQNENYEWLTSMEEFDSIIEYNIIFRFILFPLFI